MNRGHTIACVLAGPCLHERKNVHNCVMCAKKLELQRDRLDTCSERCFQALLERQRANG